MPTEEVTVLQVELRHPSTARDPINYPWADKPGPRTPEVAGCPGERNRVGNVLFVLLRSPGVRKLESAGPFSAGIRKHPDPDGRIPEGAMPDRDKAAPKGEPPVPAPASHVEAQALLNAILRAESVVAPRAQTAH